MSHKNTIQQLESLLKKIENATSWANKIEILDAQQITLNSYSRLTTKYPFLNELSPEEEYVVKSLIILDQSPVFNAPDAFSDIESRFKWLLHSLLSIEDFYAVIGGIIGYHLTFLRLVEEHQHKAEKQPKHIQYLKPKAIDLTSDTKEIRKAVRNGIEMMDQLAEMYPIGGAGDRLNLVDERTHKPLPAALLEFGGISLFEGIIRDLQAREYLHFKLTGNQLITPIAAMTSSEKNNHYDILALCEERNWFGRGKENYRFFIQPLAPVITKEGHWSLAAPLALTLKPGGHGVIWQLAKDEGIYDWLALHGRQKALLRQINNPIAGVDHGMLALGGIGCGEQKTFGFATCDRYLNTAEGMVVLVEEEKENEYRYTVSNIEYNVFHCKGLKDEPTVPGGKISAFPANTNILFADLKEIQEILHESPLPGLLVNLKSQFPYLDEKGVHYVAGGRLETTMQNISDSIIEKHTQKVHEDERLQLKTFVTDNTRRKTISVTKKSYKSGESILETPEGAYYDHLANMYDLFVNHCGFTLPKLRDVDEHLEKGPSFIIWHHPALGPLYDVIGQKIQKGELKDSSELILNIADVDIQNLTLQGSMQIYAQNLMGELKKDIVQYGEQTGKCTLINVKVINAGISQKSQNCYWKNSVDRNEHLTIYIEGNGEFYAKDVIFEGPHEVIVKNGYLITAEMENGKIIFYQQKINKPTWSWNYQFDDEDRIRLTLKR